MKAIVLVFISIFFFIESKSQINQYDKPAEYHYQPNNSYQSPDYGLLMKIGEAMKARYENNKVYRDNLIDWIFDIKAKANDKQLIDALNVSYSKLRAMDNQDFGQLKAELDNIKFSIKEEIDNYNTRMKEAPKKMFESACNNLKDQNYIQAINEFSNLIENDNNCFQCFLGRGIAYYKVNKLSNSLADLNKFIESNNNEAMAYSYRGWVKYYQNDFLGALSDFNREIELNPSAISYYDRGSAKSSLRDNLGAISDYTKAIELQPNFSMAYNNRGWAKYLQKKYNAAIIDFNKSIEFDSDNWVAYDSRQETKFALNDIKGCIEDCNMAIWKNPKCSNSYFYRGRAFQKQMNNLKACEDWSKAGELGKREAYEYISKFCKN